MQLIFLFSATKAGRMSDLPPPRPKALSLSFTPSFPREVCSSASWICKAPKFYHVGKISRSLPKLRRAAARRLPLSAFSSTPLIPSRFATDEAHVVEEAATAAPALPLETPRPWISFFGG